MFGKRFNFKFENQKINWYAELDNVWKTIEFTVENLKTVRGIPEKQWSGTSFGWLQRVCLP